jgi:effector-binding domain-containing protein
VRKKIFLGIGLILTLIVVFLIWAPLNFGIKREIAIKSSIYNVAPELTNLRNWKNWYPELETADTASFTYSASTTAVNSFLRMGDHQYTILEGNPAYTLVKEQSPGNLEYHSLYASPDTFGISSRVVWIRSISPLHWLRDKLFPQGEMDTALQHLKRFMEDPSQYYGFPLSIVPVEDTLVLTTTQISTKKDRIPTLLGLYQQLHEFGKLNRIDVSQIPMASFSPTENDSIRISAGIPVSQKGPVKKGIAYLSMPKMGRMVKGTYEGPYSGLKRLYHAMEKFMSDKGLQKISLPYEKYVSGPPSLTDSGNIRINLCFPIL